MKLKRTQQFPLGQSKETTLTLHVQDACWLPQLSQEKSKPTTTHHLTTAPWEDTRLLVDLDGGQVPLQTNDLPHQFTVTHTDQLVHGGSTHLLRRHHYKGGGRGGGGGVRRGWGKRNESMKIDDLYKHSINLKMSSLMYILQHITRMKFASKSWNIGSP